MNHYIPQAGDVNVTGTVIAAFVSGGGILVADQVQGQAGTEWAGQGYAYNPLRFQFTSGSFSVGQRVTFSVVQGPYAAGATDVQAL